MGATRTFLLTAVLGTAAVGMSACSPLEEGVSAVTVDDAGQVVVLVKTCDTEVESIEIREGREPGERYDDRLATDADTDEDDEASFTLDLDVADLHPGSVYEAKPVSSSNHSVLGRTTFSVAALQALEPGEVLVGGGAQRVSESDFFDAECHDNLALEDPRLSHTEDDALRSLERYAVALGHWQWGPACDFLDDGPGDRCGVRLESEAPLDADLQDVLRSFDVSDVGTITRGPCGFHVADVPGLGAVTMLWREDAWIVASTQNRKAHWVNGRVDSPARLKNLRNC